MSRAVTEAERHSRGVRLAFLIAGHAALVLGVMGFLLPLLPGTVFLLAAAACYARGSERFYGWLLEHKWLGPPVKDWYTHRAMTVRSKVIAIASLLVGIGISVTFVADALWLRLVLAGTAVGVAVMILLIKTRREHS